MADVTGCDWDVFISYCQKNNQINVGAAAGWVDNFIRQLSIELEQRPEIDSPKIFVDYKGLLPGQDLDDDLKNAIRSSAVILVILSHRYLESGWCKMEREEFSLKNEDFSGQVKEMLGSKSNLSQPSRIFIVEYEAIPIKNWPKEFRSILSSKMWVKDIRGQTATLGWPVPKTDQIEYYVKIADLSKGIAKQLREIKGMNYRGEADQEKYDNAPTERNQAHDDIDRKKQELRILIDSSGDSPELEIIINETAIEGGIGYSFLGRNFDSFSSSIRREKFINQIKTCSGFIIIHDYDNKNKIDAKMSAYKKALTLRKGREPFSGTLILTRKTNNSDTFRPLPKYVFPQLKIIKHESEEKTRIALTDFFQEYRNELGLNY